jgi:hypothetical protein
LTSACLKNNIENGKGIFASYSEVIKEFKNLPIE